jgi:MATE family multidrug resistance protein
MSLLIILCATSLPFVFLDRYDPTTPTVAASAATLLLLVAAFQLANGLAIVTAGALRGLRDTRVPALLAGVSYWGVGLPAGLTLGFPLHLGVVGVWIGLAFGMTTAALLLLARFRHSTEALTR